MIARVTTWTGGTADGIRAAGEEMQELIKQGPPPGVTSAGITVLIDPDGERALMIGLFESIDDLRESEPVLKAMTPPEGLGAIATVDIYEVAAEARM